MSHSYEALPVLINIFIFYILIIMYGGRALVSNSEQVFITPKSIYPNSIIYFCLLIIYCTFAYADNDFYHYVDLYEYGLHNRSANAMEPVYYHIMDLLPQNYYLWRTCIWGIAVIFLYLIFNTLCLKGEHVFFSITLFFLTTLSIMRGNLGICIMFYGLALLVTGKNNPLRIIIAILLLIISCFFHRSMLLPLTLVPFAFFRFSRAAFIISLVLFPVLVHFADTIITHVISNQGLQLVPEDTNAKLLNYLSSGAEKSNIIGRVVKFIQYFPILAFLIYLANEITKGRVKFHKNICVFFVYWYIITYIAFVFAFQNASGWLFARFIMMGYLPMTIVIAYYLKEFKLSRYIRFLLFWQLFYCTYRLAYVFFTRMRAENFFL